MSHLDKYKGIIPAFYACYDEEGNISPERIEMLTEHYIQVGVKGLYVGGSSGECIYQTIEERKLVLEHVMKVAKGKLTVIAHVAAPSTRHSIELAQHAEAVGADALSAIPPIYFTLPEHAIEAYWTEIMQSTKLDFIIYNIPQTTNYSLSTALYLRMLEHDQVVGVKNSSMPVQDIFNLKHYASKEVVVFNGPDEQFVAGRLMGADAGIGGTYGVMPELFLAANQAIIDGDLDRAQRIQYRIDEIIFKMVSGHGNLYDIMKSILAKNGLNIGRARSPLPRANDADQMIIEASHALIEAAKKEFD